MKLEQIPFQAVDWSGLAPTLHAGDSGSATWRTQEHGDVRTRIVEYSPGYVVATGDGAHRSRTVTGAKLFIVD